MLYVCLLCLCVFACARVCRGLRMCLCVPCVVYCAMLYGLRAFLLLVGLPLCVCVLFRCAEVCMWFIVGRVCGLLWGVVWCVFSVCVYMCLCV